MNFTDESVLYEVISDGFKNILHDKLQRHNADEVRRDDFDDSAYDCQMSTIRCQDARHESLPHMRTSMSQASSLTVKDNVSYIMSHVAFGFVLMSFMLHLHLILL